MVGVARLFVDHQRKALGTLRAQLEAILAQLNDDDANWRPAEQGDSMASLVAGICQSMASRFGADVFESEPAAPTFDLAARRSVNELKAMLAERFSLADAILARMPLTTLIDPKVIGRQRTYVLNLLADGAAADAQKLGRITQIAAMRLGPRFGQPASAS